MLKVGSAAFSIISVVLTFTSILVGQSTNASIAGYVTDPSKAVIVEAKVVAINISTNIRYEGITNKTGSYFLSNLPPGPYRLEVEKAGFRTVVKPDVILHVQDAVAINFDMTLGSTSEVITVAGGTPIINTTDASVSTVIDRNFAENIPMNGRSFQSLIELAPGVVATASNSEDMGQFSINGQRPSANYWTVDGVSANLGTSPYGQPGNGLGGTISGFSVQGGTNSLVSVDALQEFRIQTSTYAPEFGRTPGGQVSIVTRSGTNQFHGTVFDYLRNDALDASNWFNGYTNSPPLPKAKERQNDFGGTLSGPIAKNKTFFFFSYEGLRLRLPQTALTTVPDASFTPGGTTNSRHNAIPAMQPFLSAYPLPNPGSPELFATVPCSPSSDPSCPASGVKQVATGTAALNASYSDPSSLDAYSIRIDHKISHKLSAFGRYNYSPSSLSQRGGGGALSQVSDVQITMQTSTIGAIWIPSVSVVNDFRFNYSRVAASDKTSLDNFDGAVAPSLSAVLPRPFTEGNAQFAMLIFSLTPGSNAIIAGATARNLDRQLNIVDGLSLQHGAHSLKFGIDYRRLTPVFNPRSYQQTVGFADVLSAGLGSLAFSDITAQQGATFLFRNLGVFAQDTWRTNPRLVVTYGLRWDVDFSPSTISGPNLLSVTGFNNPTTLAVGKVGQPLFNTRYGNLAPRIGGAYQISQVPEWSTVLRAGFGVFYDLATAEVGNQFAGSFPFFAVKFAPGGSFPLNPAQAAPPAFSPIDLISNGIQAFDPHLYSPYTLEWNSAIEQGLGKGRTLTTSYVGAAGRRLLETGLVPQPNPNFARAFLTANGGTSDYNALQLQFKQRVSSGLQVLSSYTWAHSIDTGSASSLAILSNFFSPQNNGDANRGPSDFDIRHALSLGLTYDIPAPTQNGLLKHILRGWSTQSMIQTRSAPPIDISYSSLSFLSNLNGYTAAIRPDLVPATPVYLHGSQYPGGKALNAKAFIPPPTDPNTGAPLRQGDLGRNALRGFGATQWDLALHREFPVYESLKLQFRAEMFNILNHPNFGLPNGDLGSPLFPNALFGLSTKMLGESLNSNNTGGGAFSPLYQLGGPRSIQIGMKLAF